MLPLDIHIEGQKVEILPEWREKIEAELGRLQKHYSGPILHARVEMIGTAHHRLGAFEVHLVVTVPGEVITVIRQGESFIPCWWRPSTSWTGVWRSTRTSSSRRSRPTRSSPPRPDHPPFPGGGLRLHRNRRRPGGLFPCQCPEKRQFCRAESGDRGEIRPGGRGQRPPGHLGPTGLKTVLSFEKGRLWACLLFRGVLAIKGRPSGSPLLTDWPLATGPLPFCGPQPR